MEWPGDPVVLNTRPAQNRGRLSSDYALRQPVYYQDPDGMLVPSAAVSRVHRSASARRPTPAQIVINNEFEGHEPSRSPSHGHRRHSSHGHTHGRDYCYDSYSSDEVEHSRPRRHRSRRAHRSPSRSPSPYYDPEYDRKMKKLEELEKREEEEAAREKYEEERILKEARKAKKKKEEEELKKKAIEQYEIKKLEEQAKKEKEKREADEEFEKRVKKTFGQAGYDEESIEKILKRGEKGSHKKQHQIMDLRRPTYVKVHRKHISPETLDVYDLPWEWDGRDANYILIQRWIPEHDQAMLFEHTRKMREEKQRADTTIELKKERDKLMLVRNKSSDRRKSPARNWMFT